MGDKSRGGVKRRANPTPKPTPEQRLTAAIERLDYWRGLSPAEKIADLDRRLGPGVGAVKQRAKLGAA